MKSFGFNTSPDAKHTLSRHKLFFWLQVVDKVLLIKGLEGRWITVMHLLSQWKEYWTMGERRENGAGIFSIRRRNVNFIIFQNVHSYFAVFSSKYMHYSYLFNLIKRNFALLIRNVAKFIAPVTGLNNSVRLLSLLHFEKKWNFAVVRSFALANKSWRQWWRRNTEEY